MIRRPPRSTRTDTRFPYTTLVRSAIPQAAAIAEPEGVGIVGDDKIEAAIGVRVERAERRRRGSGIGMIQGFEHQLAPAAQARRRTECSFAVEHRGNHAVIVYAEPASAGPPVAKIGRASRRERVFRYVYVSGGADSY